MITKRRAKPRPGRLRGKEMEALRRECFERDKYRCQYRMSRDSICGDLLTWETAEMAHIKSRGAGGIDCLENVTTKCRYHHRIIEHQYGVSGVKPCPPKVAVDA